MIVHSSRQLELAASQLGLRQKVAFLPYGVDTDFWRPCRPTEEPLVVSAGRDHRDFATLARACGTLPVGVYVAAGSLFSPTARQDGPGGWPDNFEVAFARPHELRVWYDRARLVVVPLLPNDFQAGITVIMEAMAMAKPVIVTATEGQRDTVVDGVTGLLVPPGDAETLRDLVRFLLANEGERRRLGANAREAAVSQFGLVAYADKLAGHLSELGAGAGATNSQ